MTTVLLTGGTGTLGRLVAPLLRDKGADVRVLTRKTGDDFVTGDLTTGEGIDEAVAGVDTIVHCAGTSKGDDAKARTLVDAAHRAGSPHLVFISVVGADRIPVVSAIDRAMFGYFASKRAAEQVIESSGLPWTTLRATQFHELVLQVAKTMVKLPLIPVFPGVRVQPVDAGEVAARLTELALGTPSGLVPEMAGPQIYGMKEILRDYLKATGKHRLTVPIPLPGKAAQAFRTGANLARDHATGHRTWEDFRTAHLP